MISLFTNLIDNGINASAENSKIIVKFYKVQNNTYIEINDNGCGIDNKDILDIFKPFYRVNKARSRENGGQG